MAVRKRGDAWQADFSVSKKRYRRDFDTEAEALAWEREAIAAAKSGKPVPDPNTSRVETTMQDVLDSVVKLDWARKRGSKGSIVNAQRFVNFVGPHVSPEYGFSQENMDAFFEDLIERNRSGSTLNRYCSAISKLQKRALKTRSLREGVELPWSKEGVSRLRYFSEEEEALVLQTLKLWSQERVRDFFIVLVDTGMRTWKECRDLAWRDIEERPHPIVNLWGTKNDDNRSVPLTARALEAINRHRSQQGGPFQALSKDDCRRLWDKMRATHPQLEDTVWYTARHTFASRLVQRGVDLYRVKTLMGHRTIKMTMRYAHLAPQNLIDAVGVLEPNRGGHNGGPALNDRPVETYSPEVLEVAARIMREMRQGKVTVVK